MRNIRRRLMAENILYRQTHLCPPASAFSIGSCKEGSPTGTPFHKTYSSGYKTRISTMTSPVLAKGAMRYSVADGYALYILFFDADTKYLKIYKGWLYGTGVIPDQGQTYIGITIRKNDNSTVMDIEALYNAAQPKIGRKI